MKLAELSEAMASVWPTEGTAKQLRAHAAKLELLRLRARLVLLKASLGREVGPAQESLQVFTGLPHLEERVLDPAFMAWSARLHGIEPSSPQLMRHLDELPGFSLAPSLLSTPRAIEVETRLNRTGTLPLALAGELEFGTHMADTRVRVTAPPSQSFAALSWAEHLGRLNFRRIEDGATLTPSLRIWQRVATIQVVGANETVSESLSFQPGGRTGKTTILQPTETVVEDIRLAMEEIGRTSQEFRLGVEMLVRWIVPLASPILYSYSQYDLPGLIFIRHRTHDPLWNAELILHEAAHTWLSLLMRLDRIVNPSRDAYVSPWRRDRRPLRGILAGTHAFMIVTHYMLQKWRSGDAPERPIAHRAVSEYRRALKGLQKLERTDAWTEAGGRLADALQAYSDEARKILKELQRSSGDWKGEAEPYHWPGD